VATLSPRSEVALAFRSLASQYTTQTAVNGKNGRKFLRRKKA
jgi:hypothetical protein